MSTRLRITVTRSATNPARWTLAYGGAGVPALGTRSATLVETRGYPIFKADDASAWDRAAVAQAAVNIAAKQVVDGDTATFGRHLFQVLVGDAVFAGVSDIGGIELFCDDRDFSRAPWEMIRL